MNLKTQLLCLHPETDVYVWAQSYIFMKYYPVNLDIKNRNCLVVGGGVVGSRKAFRLLDCGALVTVVSLEFTDNLDKSSDNCNLVLKKKTFDQSDLKGIFLVIGATDDENLNREISIEAQKHNILCNIADRPKISNFILPAVVNRGDLVIGISTSGKSPALARRLRSCLETEFGNEYADFLILMGEIRKKLLSKKHKPEAYKHIFEKIISENIIQMIKENRKEDINAILYKILGKGYEFDNLVNPD